MKKLISLSLLIALLFSFVIPANAQLPVCTVTGTIYDTNGLPFVGAKITIHKVIKEGNLIRAFPQTYLTITGGTFSISIPRNSVAWIEAPVGEFNFAGGVPVQIPNAGTVALVTLQSPLNFPQQIPVVTVNGLADPTSARGDTLVRDATNVVVRLPLGASGRYLRSNGTDLAYSTIQAADIPSGIDAARVANGTVSNTEYQYLDGLTSNLQTQLNGKQNTLTTGNLLVGTGLSITGGTGSVIGSNATINLGSNVVTSIVNDTNIQGSISNNVLTLSYASTMAKNRQHPNTVYNDQINVWGNFAQSFQAGSNFNLLDPNDTTKKARFDLSNITTGNTRTVNVPNANSTTVQPFSAVTNQFVTSISSQGVVSSAQPAIADISGLTAALAAKAADNAVLHLSGNETALGDKTFSASLTTFGIIPAGAGAQGNSSAALVMRGGVGTIASPSTVTTPGYYFEMVKSGGTNGVASFGENKHFQVTGQSAADYYPYYEYVELAPNFSSAPDNVPYFVEAHRLYVRANPSNISNRSYSIYGFSSQVEKLTAMVGLRGHYSELRNNSGTDADNSIYGSRNTSWAYVTSANSTNHNTGLIFHEGVANYSSAYYGEAWGPESVVARFKDSTLATATMQGTWSATNGSATVTGTSGNGANECEQGAWLSINGTWARVASCSANSITLTTTFSGSTGSGLTISKAVSLWWLREKQALMSLNHAGTSRLDILHVDENDRIRIGYSLVPAVFGSYTSHGTPTLGSPSDTLTAGWTNIVYDGGSGGRFGRGVESGNMWDVSPTGYKHYYSSSAAPVLGFGLSSTGNFYIGGAALATNATNGFLYVPTSAGAPTGTPTSITGTAALEFDTTNRKLKIYGSGWETINPTFETAYCVTTATALATNTRTGDIFRGYGAQTQNDDTAIEVPSGKTLKILAANIKAQTGASAGTYLIKLQLKNVTDGTYQDLVSISTTSTSATVTNRAVGTVVSPIATIAGSKRFNLVVLNDSTSPGALGTGAQIGSITYVIE